MCSICGGSSWDGISEIIWKNSEDRGRDAHGKIILPTGEWIGNHRATPTTEVELPIEKQPVGNNPYFVFNGIISNDHELGIREGEADTSVIPRIAETSSLEGFCKSLSKIIGSYAIACLFDTGKIWLACNYKPIWICRSNKNYYFSSLGSHFPSFLNPWKMTPYTIQELTENSPEFSVERIQKKKAVVICSSGLDSTSVAAYAVYKHGTENVTLLHFDYACQAGKREGVQIKKIADHLKVSLKIIDMRKINIFGKDSPLLSNQEVAQGKNGAEYAHEWVPARNLVMLSLTTAFSEANGFGHIYIGSNLEEAGAYPDNEEQFILDFENLLYGAVQNGLKIEIHSPLGGLMKHEIIPFGYKYGAPFHLTWSCYLGGDRHCGKCGPCFMRKTAFIRNGLKDPVFE